MNNKKGHTNFFKIAMLFVCIFVLFVGSFLCFFAIFYPVKYKNIILENCDKFNVNYVLAFSIVNAESKFVSSKISAQGAIGLMQIMPTTAVFIANELDYENFSAESLFEPEVNLQFGIYYLSYLSQKFKTLEQVICAYNAGETAVRSWLSNKDYSSDGNKLDVIPYTETRSYLQKVQKNMKIYKKIITKSLVF